MQRTIQLRGKNTAEKLSHLERILGSFKMRLSRTVIGIIPPVPFMCYAAAPKDGVLANILVPISGTVDKAYVRIGRYSGRGARLEINIESGSQEHTFTLECSKPAHSFDVGWHISAGDLVIVYGEGVQDVHIAFAVQPTMDRTVKEKHMLEGFLALQEREANGVQE